MAVQNTLTPKKEVRKNEICFFANGAQVTLTPETVKNYLVSGDKDRVTMQEVVMFMNLCKFNGLNPWFREEIQRKLSIERVLLNFQMKRLLEGMQKYGAKTGIIVTDRKYHLTNM